MRSYLKFVLLLIAVSPIVFSGCKKDHGYPITIDQISTAVTKEGNHTGTFETRGAFETSGTFYMVINLISPDSIHCINTLTAPEGMITMQMKCSLVANTGVWHITGGTERYRNLRGGGTLVMIFAPGEIAREISTGQVFLGG